MSISRTSTTTRACLGVYLLVVLVLYAVLLVTPAAWAGWALLVLTMPVGLVVMPIVHYGSIFLGLGDIVYYLIYPVSALLQAYIVGSLLGMLQGSRQDADT